MKIIRVRVEYRVGYGGFQGGFDMSLTLTLMIFLVTMVRLNVLDYIETLGRS